MHNRPYISVDADAQLAPISSASSVPRPIELETALAQLDGDRETLNEAISMFVETIPTMVGDIQAAYRQANAERLQVAAHSLKGAAANICAEPTRQAA